MFEGLRKPMELIVIAVTLLAYGFRFKPSCMLLAWMSGPWPEGGLMLDHQLVWHYR